jgi:hypothetical protein
MKRIITTIAITAMVCIIGTQTANARWGGGGMPVQNTPNFTSPTTVDPGVIEARKQFFIDTIELRKKIAAIRIELHGLYYDENADPQVVENLRAELFDLHEELNKLAAEAGIGTDGWGYGMMGSGMPAYGYGSGSCWGNAPTTN